MDTAIAKPPRPRPAHTHGPTYVAYTPDGTKLITAGSNNTIRVHKTGVGGEPANIDDSQGHNTAVDSTVSISFSSVEKQNANCFLG